MSPAPRPTARRFIAVFAAVALSFIGASIYSQSVERLINRDALDIADNAAPSILHLSAARAEMRHLQTLLADYAHNSPPDPRAAAAITRARRLLRDEYDAYILLPTFPGETELWKEVSKRVDQMDRVVDHVLEPMRRGDAHSAQVVVDQELTAAADDAAEAVSRSIEFDATHARELAMRIADARSRSVRIEAILDGVNVLLAIGAALMLLRAVRQHTDLLEAHGKLSAGRAEELEQFAARVAHDILSPLASTGMALGIARKKLASDEKGARALDRGLNSLERVQRIVDGLLEFARAGARPAPDARSDVRRVLEDVLEDVRPSAADGGVDLVVRTFGPCWVAASPGVLTSLLSNLLRNAIKYMGSAGVRRVEVRVHDRSAALRFEVADTGPGIPENVRASIFEAYVRGPHTGQPGVGLGLGTVKRLVEAHGGGCGVDSRLGRGSTFWFELPRADDDPPRDAAPSRLARVEPHDQHPTPR